MTSCSKNDSSNQTGASCNTDENAHEIYRYDLSKSFTVSLSIYFIILIFGGIFFNIVLGYTIIAVKKLHTISNVFITNLAICGFVTATATVTFDADLFLRGYFPYGKFICGMREVAFMCSLPASVACLFLLTFERFITVMYPFKRNVIFTDKKIRAMIIMSYVLHAFSSFLSNFV